MTCSPLSRRECPAVSHANFARLRTEDFSTNAYVKREQARLYVLAQEVWSEVHDEPAERSQPRIDRLLAEMADIHARKQRSVARRQA